MGSADRVLVIDDDPNIGLFCTTVLAPEGVEVHTVQTATEALDALDRQAYPVVILDIVMEELDTGCHLARTLAARWPATWVLVLSSMAGPVGPSFDLSSLPVAAVMAKPIQPSDLVDLVREGLRRSRER